MASKNYFSNLHFGVMSYLMTARGHMYEITFFFLLRNVILDVRMSEIVENLFQFLFDVR